MKNYAEMTDFEINCLVAEATGHRPSSHNMAGKAHKLEITQK